MAFVKLARECSACRLSTWHLPHSGLLRTLAPRGPSLPLQLLSEAASSACLSPCPSRLPDSPLDPDPREGTPAILCLETSQTLPRMPDAHPTACHTAFSDRYLPFRLLIRSKSQLSSEDCLPALPEPGSQKARCFDP